MTEQREEMRLNPAHLKQQFPVKYTSQVSKHSHFQKRRRHGAEFVFLSPNNFLKYNRKS